MMSLMMVVCLVGGEGVTVVEILKSSIVVMLINIVSGALVVMRGIENGVVEEGGGYFT